MTSPSVQPVVTILQTCDGTHYKPLLDISEQVCQTYAKKHGYLYRRCDGIFRGTKPWHAQFNRIYLLQQALTTGIIDWVLYMDADTLFVDLSKPLDEFLDSRYAVIGCRGGQDDPHAHWDVNSGVLFFNMRHPAMQAILAGWQRQYENVPLEKLDQETPDKFYGFDHINDQYMLQVMLCQYKPPVTLNYQGERMNAFNYDGNFIQQVLRQPGKTLDERISEMKEKADAVLSKENAN